MPISTSRNKYASVDSDAALLQHSQHSLDETPELFDATLAAEEPAPELLNQYFTPHHDHIYGSYCDLSTSHRDTMERPLSHLASEQLLAQGSATILPPLDLELQAPSPTNGLLSVGKRMKNVITYLFPFNQTYERLHNGLNTGRLQLNAPGRFVGQGTDGVFRNLTAKPDTESTRAEQEQHPPAYEEAAVDSSPEYWEATMISPMYEDEVFVHGLPVGNFSNFVWNIMVTVAFQLVGFVLCYLLHTSHAAKQGTRAGLGITIVMYGYNAIPANFGRPDRLPTRYEPNDPNLIDISKSLLINAGGAVDTFLLGFVQNLDINGSKGGAKTPSFSYAFIAFGILVLLKSSIDYHKIKKEEKRILAPLALEETHTTTEVVNNPPPS